MELEELIKLIINRRIGMVENSLLTPELKIINQELYDLDIVAHRKNLKWGIGRLLELASPELQLKWSAQIAKLNDAIMNSNVLLVQELIVGCKRGWDALERAAVAAGHVPYEPQFWEVSVDAKVYRVVRHREELDAVPVALNENCVCLEELVNVFHVRHQNVFKVEVEKEKEVKKPFHGDKEIGF